MPLQLQGSDVALKAVAEHDRPYMVGQVTRIMLVLLVRVIALARCSLEHMSSAARAVRASGNPIEGVR